MAQFSVTSFEEMERVAKQLEGYSLEYKRIAADLLSRASTMGSAWEGEDNAAFVAQISELKDDLDNMAAKIDEAGKMIRAQKEHYSNQQQLNIDSVKKLIN